MATIFQVPKQSEKLWQQFRDAVTQAFRMLEPTGTQLPEVPGLQRPKTLPEMIAGAMVPGSMKEGLASGVFGLTMPMYLAENYRTPETIQALRRTMAEEMRSRGPVETIQGPMKPMSTPGLFMPTRETDPADLILRGSWYHGMNEKARQELANKLTQEQIDAVLQRVKSGAKENQLNYGLSLNAANQVGLPGSPHAFPGGYVRFGEPYGVSLSASPVVSGAGAFTPDQMIHRVMPLYGGPPTERVIQLWKPEGAKAFNEAYNEALNKFITTPLSEMPQGDLWGGVYRDLSHVIADYYRTGKPEDAWMIPSLFFKDMNMSSQLTGKFNRQFSDALQSSGYRGVLYNPNRYGEYEMLMLDPKYALPLDYRIFSEYAPPGRHFSLPMGRNVAQHTITPGARKGYQQLQPEFNQGTSKLRDVFNLQPWVDRINPENWQRIMEQIDPAYVEQVANMLFRK